MSSPVKTERDAGTVERLIHCKFTGQDREGCGYCRETDTL